MKLLLNGFLLFFFGSVPSGSAHSGHYTKTLSDRILVVPRGGSNPSSSISFRRPATLRASLLGKRTTQRYQPPREIQEQPRESTEDAKDVIESFLTVDSRRTFISRVYSILAIQLLVTLGSIVLFTEVIPTNFWLNNLWATAAVPGISLLVSTITWIITCTNVQLRRKRPFLLVSIFTIAEALCMGYISTLYPTSAIWPAVFATAVAVFAVSTYTIATRNRGADISQWGAGISSCGLVMCSYALLYYVFGVPLPMHDTIYGMAGAGLFSLYLAYHTRTIVSGKYTAVKMNDKDYILGAMTLYNDIINMFLYILRIIGEDKHHD